MRVFAVYDNQMHEGYDFVMAFLDEGDAQAARANGLGTDVEEIEVRNRRLEFKLRYSVQGNWRRTAPTKGIPLSDDAKWVTTWNDLYVYWEHYSGYDELPDVEVVRSTIQSVLVRGLDRTAVSAAYSTEAKRWQLNRAKLMDLARQENHEES